MTKIPYSIRLEPDLLKKIKKAAERENRSVNNYIETALSISVEKQ